MPAPPPVTRGGLGTHPAGALAKLIFPIGVKASILPLLPSSLRSGCQAAL